MKQNSSIYAMPNMGCLLGVAFQRQYSSLEAELKSSGVGITAPEYLIMRVLINNSDLQPCEIADILGKDKAAISRCLTSLVEKGLVETNSVSHKCKRLQLTDKGSDLVPVILKVAETKQRELARVLTQNEMNLLQELLIKIINN